MPARDHRRTAKKLAGAGRWPEALQVAQETGALDDELLLRAIDGLTDEVKSSLHIVDECTLAKGQFPASYLPGSSGTCQWCCQEQQLS